MTRVLLALRFVGRQLLLLARDRQLVFWNVGFFLLLLVIFLGVLSGGEASVQVTLAAGLVTTGVMANALFSIGVGLSSARARGVFRRYAVTPAPRLLPLYGAAAARLVVVAIGAALQVAVAAMLFGVPWSGGAASWIALVTAGSLAFGGIGLAIAAAAPAPHVANAAANLVFMPMLALGGTALPVSMMPESWQQVYWMLPNAAMFDGLLGAFVSGQTVADHAGRLAYLAAWAAATTGWATWQWSRRDP